MKYYRNIALFTMILAFCVVVLGAFTRLTGAGLGCPDWPGCYGQLVLPSKVQALQIAQEHYPHSPIESRKAWTEMSHRYVAGTLVILVIILNGFAWRYRRQGAPRGVSLLLLGLIGFQAALGMWTVTLKLLPVVVMGHLLGGLLTFVSLVYLNWRLSGYSGARRPAWRGWVNLGIGIVFCQIALGGWVSANYAGIACVGFPTCNGQWLPQLYWLDSFHFWSKIGENYQGGLLTGFYSGLVTGVVPDAKRGWYVNSGGNFVPPPISESAYNAICSSNLGSSICSQYSFQYDYKTAMIYVFV